MLANVASGARVGQPGPAVRPIALLCIPHAGGGASAFRGWHSALAPWASVHVLQLPGRESRFREPPLLSLEDVLLDLHGAATSNIAGPFALFGHSMGGLLAFELAHRLVDSGREPAHIFVSACRAPQLPQLEAPCASLSDQEFIAEVMGRYGGIPEPILADQELMAAILPTLRADFNILERYRLPARRPLECPISVFGGWHDRTTPEDALAGWAHQTRGTFRLQMVEDGHFYLQSKRPALVRGILSALVGQ